MTADVLGPRRAAAVAVEPGHRVGRAGEELAADDVSVRMALHAATIGLSRGGRCRRDPRPRVPDREAADDAGRLSADAERAPARLQPVHEPRPGRRLRRGDDPRRAAAALAQGVGAARVRPGEPRRQVPPARAGDARARRRRDLGALRADAARPADAGRAEAAHRAPAPVRRPSPTSRRRSLRLAERGLAVRLERRPGQKEERYAQLLGDEVDVSALAGDDGAMAEARPVLARDPLEERVAALEAEVAAIKAELGL